MRAALRVLSFSQAHLPHTPTTRPPPPTHTPWEHDWVSTELSSGVGRLGREPGLGWGCRGSEGRLCPANPAPRELCSSVIPSRSSQPGTEICWISKVCPVGGGDPQEGTGQPSLVTKGEQKEARKRKVVPRGLFLQDTLPSLPQPTPTLPDTLPLPHPLHPHRLKAWDPLLCQMSVPPTGSAHPCCSLGPLAPVQLLWTKQRLVG